MSPTLDSASEIDIWINCNMNLPVVQALRNEMNKTGKVQVVFICSLINSPSKKKPMTLSQLKKHKTNTLVGLLKLWLIQLPLSVGSHELYEPLKVLYLSKSDEFISTRLGSIKSLLVTLSKPHLQCLTVLSNHWHGLTVGLDKDNPKV